MGIMNNQKSGFTLLEMIVAVGIFTIVITIAMTSLLNLNKIHNDSIIFSRVQDNLRFALEVMAKEIRVGMTYNCGGETLIPQDCEYPDGRSTLTFKNPAGQTVTYRLGSNNQIERSSDGAVTFLALTSSDITIEELTFYVTGALEGDEKQPKILIKTKASSAFRSKKIEINLQTLASSRILDS